MHSTSNFTEFNRFLLLVVLFFVFSGFIHSQNLIPNSTFLNSETKSTVHYPNELMRNPVVPKHWEMVVGYPDFFNNSNSTYLGYPILNAEQGTGGKLGMRMTASNNEFEAVETKLTRELIKGEKYKVSFTIAQCNYSNYSMDMIPFILSNERVTEDNVFQSTTQNLCILQTSEKYKASDGWKSVSFIYEAKGGERYFTLLNNSYTATQHERSKVNRTRFNFTGNQLDGSAYYFFNQISLELANGEDACPTLPVDPNPKELSSESVEAFQKELQVLSKLGLMNLDVKKLKQEKLLDEHIIFVIDFSGSMKNVFPDMKVIVNNLLKNIPDHQLVSLVVFNSESRTVFNRVNKANLADSVDRLISYGQTSLANGFLNMNSLINPSEQTVLEIFTDEQALIMTYIQEYRPNQFAYSKTNEYYIKYESVISPELSRKIINDTADLRILKHIYKTSYPRTYINFKPSKFNDFQYSKECNSNVQNDLTIEESRDVEKVTNTVYLIDVSASMNEGSKLSELKKSVLAYNETLNSNNRVSLVSFSSSINVLLNSVPTNDAQFTEIIQKLEGKGSTKINDGINYVYSHYKNVKHQNLSFVLFTDGKFVLFKESERIILENQDIHLSIFQFGDKKNHQLTELTKDKKMNYKRISPKDIKSELLKMEKEFPFPKRFSLAKPEVWKYFQKHLLEITGYND